MSLDPELDKLTEKTKKPPKPKKVKVKPKFKPTKVRTVLEIIHSENCFCSEDKLKYQSMCHKCVNKLPNHIKFELWRPTEDGFIDVFKDAIKFLTDNKVDIETIDYSEPEEMVY